VAEKCEREKKALDKATDRREMAEGRLNDLEFEIEEWEAEGQRALGSAISDCTDSEQRLDENCVIDRWEYAWKLLDAAQRWRSGSVYMDYLTRLEQMQEDEEHRKAAYCECLNETHG
jgi:hypothetical protein